MKSQLVTRFYARFIKFYFWNNITSKFPSSMHCWLLLRVWHSLTSCLWSADVNFLYPSWRMKSYTNYPRELSVFQSTLGQQLHIECLLCSCWGYGAHGTDPAVPARTVDTQIGETHQRGVVMDSRLLGEHVTSNSSKAVETELPLCVLQMQHYFYCLQILN